MDNAVLITEDVFMTNIASNLETDPAAAKSWILVGKTIFPQSFKILFENYKMEKNEMNLNGCVLCLSELIKTHSKELTLVEELRRICYSLGSDTNEFSKMIFQELSDDVKYHFIIAVTINAQYFEDYCDCMLLFLKNIANGLFMRFASNFVSTLLSAEDQLRIKPFNQLRKMLICDVLDLILTSQSDHKFKITLNLLEKAIEFYVYFIFHSKSPRALKIRKDVEILSAHPDGSWKELLRLYYIAFHYKWNSPESFALNFTELGLKQHILNLKNKTRLQTSPTIDRHDDTSAMKEAYFFLLSTFFYYLYNFGKLIHSKIYTGMVSGPYNFICMEGIVHYQKDFPKIMPVDLQQTTEGTIIVSECSNLDATLLVTSFTTAVECYETFNYHQTLADQFNALCARIEVDKQLAFQEFYINSLMYKKQHKKALENLHKTIDNVTDITHKDKIALQMASCYFFLEDYEKALNILFDVITHLKPTTEETSVKPINKCPVRHMYFMTYTNCDILKYCINLLLKLYKDKVQFEDIYEDMGIAHMLVLIQYNLHEESSVLNRCLETIKKKNSFSFPKFFKYIIHPDILEKVSHLGTGGNVDLRLLPLSTNKPNIIRGAKKQAKDSLKSAFTKQMARCHGNIENLFLEFFNKEQEYLLLPLTNGKCSKNI